MKKKPIRKSRPAARKKPSKPKGRLKYVIGNWKMNPQSLEDAKEIFKKVKRAAKGLKHTEAAICPPFVYLSELAKLSDGSLRTGVQDVFWAESGSYTGEVSAAQARGAGADYCIVGHSERRALGETDEMVAKKAAAAVKGGMKAVLCIGEKVRDVEGGRHLEFLENQIKDSFFGLSKRDLGNVILAYEPVWAIGKSDDEAMTGKDLYEMSLYLRKILMGLYGKDQAFSLPILYGGSATAKNAEDIVKEGEVDGLLVGRQSLDSEGFAQMLAITDSL